MLKNLACTHLEWIANEAMQVFGGAGYLRGARVERIYRETKVLTIGGGSLEIMKDLAARQPGTGGPDIQVRQKFLLANFKQVSKLGN